MSIVALVPARAGSRRLPGKNMADLAGRPMIAWTIDAARAAECFGERIFVSTDDPEAARLAASRGCQVIERARELSRDETPMLAVVHDAVPCMGIAGDDLVVLLQPTSPLRAPQDIVGSVAVALSSRGDSVVAVTAHPEGALYVAPNQRLRPAFDGLRPIGAPVVTNGAVYVITAAALARGCDWYSGVAYGYVMPKIRSLDVDEPFEVEVARFLLSAGLVGAVP